tara:strand:+ start:2763 stop:3182 length:420 start_codon:yes stop_codon:yes gene_type:complete
MAVTPISQPLAPGLLAADYSPMSAEGMARSSMSSVPGLLELAGFTGKFGHTPDRTPRWSKDFVSTASGPSTGSPSSGLPMPSVEGYKYVYPKYTFSHPETGWERSGYESDMGSLDYYPYFPEGITKYDPILVGVELIKE